MLYQFINPSDNYTFEVADIPREKSDRCDIERDEIAAYVGLFLGQGKCGVRTMPMPIAIDVKGTIILPILMLTKTDLANAFWNDRYGRTLHAALADANLAFNAIDPLRSLVVGDRDRWSSATASCGKSFARRRHRTA